MAGDSADDGTIARIGVIHNNITDVHSPQRTDGGSIGRPHTAREPQKDRRVGNLAHGDVRYRDVLDVRAIDGFESQAARAIEDHVRDRDVAEVALRFGADLDAAGWAVAIGSLRERALVRAVEQRSDIVTGNQAVDDGHVFGGAREAERVGALEHDGVVVGRVDARI